MCVTLIRVIFINDNCDQYHLLFQLICAFINCFGLYCTNILIWLIENQKVAFSTVNILACMSNLKTLFKLCILRGVCTLYASAFVSDSLLHMVSYHLEKEKFELQKEGIKLSNLLNCSYSVHAGYFKYT